MEAANDILGDFLNLNPTLHSTQTKDEAYGPSSVLSAIVTFHPTTTHTSTSSNNWPIGTAITLPIHDKILECAKDGLIETAGKSLITKILKILIPILLVLAASGSILATVVVVVCLSRCRKHRGYEDEKALHMRSRNCVTSGRPFLMSPGSPVRFESYYGSDVATPIRVHTNNKYVLSPV